MTKTPLNPNYVDPRIEYHEKYVTWVIDKTLLHGTQAEKLPDVVKENGYRLITFDGNPRNYDLVDLPMGFMDEGSGPIIAYGCHRFIQEIFHQPWYPGAYPEQGEETRNLEVTTYMTKYDTMLNKDYVLLPIMELIRNSEFIFKNFNTDQLFIKDALAFKRFAAKVVTRKDIVDYLTLYKDTHHIEDSSLVLVSTTKDILSEHRFVIVNRKPIAHSTYRYDGILDIRIDIPEEALKFAEEMAKIWSPCACYTMDIAMTKDGPKILEINSFSCAGLYACDLQTVVTEVSAQAREDYFSRVYPE